MFDNKLLALGPVLSIFLIGVGLIIGGSIQYANCNNWDTGKYQFMAGAGGMLVLFSSFIFCVAGSRYNRFKVAAQAPIVTNYNYPQPSANPHLASSYPPYQMHYDVNQPIFNPTGLSQPAFNPPGYLNQPPFYSPEFCPPVFGQQGYTQPGAFNQPGLNPPVFNPMGLNQQLIYPPDSSQSGSMVPNTIVSPPPPYNFQEKCSNPKDTSNIKQ